VASAHYNRMQALRRAGLDARLFTFGDRRAEDGDEIDRRGGPAWLQKLSASACRLLFAILQPGKSAYQTADILGSLAGARRMSAAINTFEPQVIVLSDHGAPGLMLRKPKNSKVILVSHHNPARFVAHPQLGNFSKLDAKWAVALEQRVLEKVDAVVCPSAYMAEWFRRSYVSSLPLHVIPNLLDEDAVDSVPPADLRAARGLAAQTPVIYMPSAGSRLKGAEYLAELVHSLSKASAQPIAFYIPGEVSPEARQALSAVPANAHIYFAGQLPYAEQIANMKSCSFGISPSIMENYSMALLEAVMCGVPMLAFDTGGNSEIIRSGKNGFLVSEGDVAALSAQAIRLLEPAELETLRKETRDYSRRELSAQKALASYLEVIKSL
jgi:glycosyltransferase involved in cell wall biosynthesis